MAQKTIYIRPPAERLWQELEALGARRGLSVSILVEEAIRRLLKADRDLLDVDQ